MDIYAVVKRERKSRKGKGFSREELMEVGLSFKEALKLRISIDTRRSTKYNENVKALNTYLSGEVTSSEVRVGLTEVKGIGKKRFEQLKAIGKDSIKVLAESDSKEIAEKLGISNKRASRWIKDANNLLKR